MSIYGGFPTRALETAYNTYICEVLGLFSEILMSLFKESKSIERNTFSHKFCGVFSKIVKIEKQKHLWPKFSECIKDLDDYLKPNYLEIKYERSSEKISLENVSTNSLARESSSTSGRMHRVRVSTSSGNRNRELSYRNNKKKEVNVNVKKYQDKILKSILKDLSGQMF